MSARSDGIAVGSVGHAAGRWAVAGVAILLAHAILQLGLRGLPTVRSLDALEWAALIALTVAFVYVEGVRALQRRFVPYVLVRARELESRTALWLRVLAPLYAMSLVGARPRALARAWGGIAAIVAAVMIVRAFPDPWRGITDLAVAAALTWGLVHLCLQAMAPALGTLEHSPG